MFCAAPNVPASTNNVMIDACDGCSNENAAILDANSAIPGSNTLRLPHRSANAPTNGVANPHTKFPTNRPDANRLLLMPSSSVTIWAKDRAVYCIRAVGASNAFVRGPYVVEGILIGVMAAVISLILIFIVFLVAPLINKLMHGVR